MRRGGYTTRGFGGAGKEHRDEHVGARGARALRTHLTGPYLASRTTSGTRASGCPRAAAPSVFHHVAGGVDAAGRGREPPRRGAERRRRSPMGTHARIVKGDDGVREDMGQAGGAADAAMEQRTGSGRGRSDRPGPSSGAAARSAAGTSSSSTTIWWRSRRWSSGAPRPRTAGEKARAQDRESPAPRAGPRPRARRRRRSERRARERGRRAGRVLRRANARAAASGADSPRGHDDGRGRGGGPSLAPPAGTTRCRRDPRRAAGRARGGSATDPDRGGAGGAATSWARRGATTGRRRCAERRGGRGGEPPGPAERGERDARARGGSRGAARGRGGAAAPPPPTPSPEVRGRKRRPRATDLPVPAAGRHPAAPPGTGISAAAARHQMNEKTC